MSTQVQLSAGLNPERQGNAGKDVLSAGVARSERIKTEGYSPMHLKAIRDHKQTRAWALPAVSYLRSKPGSVKPIASPKIKGRENALI